MPLQCDQVGDREKARSRETEGTSRRPAVARLEQRQIHPIAQHANPVGGDPELDQSLLQPAGDRSQTVGVSRRPADPIPRHRVLGDDIEIAASRGNNDGAIEGASEQNCTDAVGIKIMGIDQIEVAAILDLPAQKRQDRGAKGERRYAHSDPGQYGIARVRDVQPLAGLLGWHPGKHAIPPEPLGLEREPWTGRDNTRADDAARNKFPQTRFDENPMLGLQQVWI